MLFRVSTQDTKNYFAFRSFSAECIFKKYTYFFCIKIVPTHCVIYSSYFNSIVTLLFKTGKEHNIPLTCKGL